jgi:EAL domain-containing protein (putative c-di-GMP-specific phosphodiesterase class I)
MPGSKALRAFIMAAVADLLVCGVLIAAVLSGPDQGRQLGGVLLAATIVTIALLPAQLVPLGIVLRDWAAAVARHRRAARRIDAVLRHGPLVTAFQPIFEVATRRVVGAEALTRFPEEIGWSPAEWFAQAAASGRGLALEHATLERALAAAQFVPAGYVAVNVSPAMLTSPGLADLLDGSGFPLERLIVEVTEQESLEQHADLLMGARAALRHRGIRLAIDDAGAGYASMQKIVDLRPDVIKIDRSLIAGLAGDPARRAMVGAVVAFGVQRGALVVAEGVETAQELEVLGRLGVDQAQGYLISRPTTDPDVWATWAPRAQPRPAPVRSDAVYVIDRAN